MTPVQRTANSYCFVASPWDSQDVQLRPCSLRLVQHEIYEYILNWKMSRSTLVGDDRKLALFRRTTADSMRMLYIGGDALNGVKMAQNGNYTNNLYTLIPCSGVRDVSNKFQIAYLTSCTIKSLTDTMDQYGVVTWEAENMEWWAPCYCMSCTRVRRLRVYMKWKYIGPIDLILRAFTVKVGLRYLNFDPRSRYKQVAQHSFLTISSTSLQRFCYSLCWFDANCPLGVSLPTVLAG